MLYYLRLTIAVWLIEFGQRFVGDLFTFDHQYIEESLRKKYPNDVRVDEKIKSLQTISSIMALDNTLEVHQLLGRYLIGKPLVDTIDFNDESWIDMECAEEGRRVFQHKFAPNVVKVELGGNSIIYDVLGYLFTDNDGKSVDIDNSIINCRILRTPDDAFSPTEYITVEHRGEPNSQLDGLYWYVTQNGKKREIYDNFKELSEFFPV